jgi:hypothetical protein
LSAKYFTKPLDLAEDEVCISGPDERRGIFIALVQVFERSQRANRGMTTPADTVLGQLGEKSLDQVEPLPLVGVR